MLLLQAVVQELGKVLTEIVCMEIKAKCLVQELGSDVSCC